MDLILKIYVINLDEYSDTGTHWVASYALDNNGTYFDILGVEYILKKVLKFINGSSITTNIYRMQTYDSVMCGYACIGFIDFMVYYIFHRIISEKMMI